MNKNITQSYTKKIENIYKKYGHLPEAQVKFMLYKALEQTFKEHKSLIYDLIDKALEDYINQFVTISEIDFGDKAEFDFKSIIN